MSRLVLGLSAAPVVPRVLDNMGAEIAIGHSCVRGGEMPEVPPSNG